METNQVHPDVLNWAVENGSFRLQKGLAEGYPMIPLVYIEWAEVHYPGFVLDLDQALKYERARCPSTQALVLADYYRQPNVTSVIVASAEKYPFYDGRDVHYARYNAECIVLRDERVPYTLVRPLFLY